MIAKTPSVRSLSTCRRCGVSVWHGVMFNGDRVPIRAESEGVLWGHDERDLLVMSERKPGATGDPKVEPAQSLFHQGVEVFLAHFCNAAPRGDQCTE